MSTDINPASKSASDAAPQAPYLCSACGQSANQIQCTLNGDLAVFWHGPVGCRGIINVQLLKVPTQVQPRLVTPSGGRII